MSVSSGQALANASRQQRASAGSWRKLVQQCLDVDASLLAGVAERSRTFIPEVEAEPLEHGGGPIVGCRDFVEGLVPRGRACRPSVAGLLRLYRSPAQISRIALTGRGPT